MKCPFCSSLQNRVIDSRLSREGNVIRRRRECDSCDSRFTTYERVEEILPMVVKKDGNRVSYDRGKVLAGLRKACEKRPVPVTLIEQMADRLERELQEVGEKEVSSTYIGERLMEQLREVDPVAYVRFASVYRSFRDINEFFDELKHLLSTRDDASGVAVDRLAEGGTER